MHRENQCNDDRLSQIPQSRDRRHIPPELIPQTPARKDSIVDLHFTDSDNAKAVELLEFINYNEAEEYLYDRYRDGVSVEATWKGVGRREHQASSRPQHA